MRIIKKRNTKHAIVGNPQYAKGVDNMAKNDVSTIMESVCKPNWPIKCTNALFKKKTIAQTHANKLGINKRHNKETYAAIKSTLNPNPFEPNILSKITSGLKLIHPLP